MTPFFKSDPREIISFLLPRFSLKSDTHYKYPKIHELLHAIFVCFYKEHSIVKMLITNFDEFDFNKIILQRQAISKRLQHFKFLKLQRMQDKQYFLSSVDTKYKCVKVIYLK